MAEKPIILRKRMSRGRKLSRGLSAPKEIGKNRSEAPEPGLSTYYEKVFPAKVSALWDVQDFVGALLDPYDCPMDVRMQIDVAVEEMFVNVAQYAYPRGSGTASVTLGFRGTDPETMVFILKDSGIPFDPTRRKDPDVTEGAEKRRIGGLGIFMVKKTMDRMAYRYENGQNVLILEKVLKSSRAV